MARIPSERRSPRGSGCPPLHRTPGGVGARYGTKKRLRKLPSGWVHGKIDPLERGEIILELAREAGFDLAGLAPLDAPADGERFRTWLADGCHGEMEWLERQAEHICAPHFNLEPNSWLLVLGTSHVRPPRRQPGGGRVARYALGRDYHNLIGKRLRKLARELADRDLIRRSRKIVDAGPLLERSHARTAGIGFSSKSANLLHRRFGPWVFLGELAFESPAPLAQPDPGGPDSFGSCGTCRACLDACPTQAITEPGRVDARLCLSYQTIENRGTIPHELRKPLDEWVFGCDVCSEVCPFGSKAPDASARFGDHPALEQTRLADWFKIGDQAEFEARFEGSPLRRTRRSGLLRNAALVLGNRPSDRGRRALEQALEDEQPLVRAASLWGLLEGHGREDGVRSAAESALARESDPEASADMRASFDSLG